MEVVEGEDAPSASVPASVSAGGVTSVSSASTHSGSTTPLSMSAGDRILPSTSTSTTRVGANVPLSISAGDVLCPVRSTSTTRPSANAPISISAGDVTLPVRSTYTRVASNAPISISAGDITLPVRGSNAASGANAPISVSAGDVVPASTTGTDAGTNVSGSGSRSSSRRSRSRDSSRRRRSGGRSRSRHGRSGRSRSRIRFKRKERNFPAAVCSMVTIVIICTAIAEPRWISLSGGGCHLLNRGLLTFLGVFQFFYSGSFAKNPADPSMILYNYGPSNNERMVNCVTMHAVFLFKSMLAFCFLAIGCSLLAFLLDLTGPSNRAFRLLRRNAVFSIMTVILCVVINLLCYWVTTVVGELQRATRDGRGEVNVTFDVSFYLMTAAGGISVLGTACNCLKRHPPSRPDTTPYLLLDDYDELEAMLGSPTFLAPSAATEGSPAAENLPPPPPYSP